MKQGFVHFIFSLLFFLPALSWGGAVITYHGRLLNPQKQPVENSSVVFKVRIYSPTPYKCLLYEEMRTVNMTGTQGVFVIPIGDGQGARTVADPGLAMEKIFSNDPNITFNATNTPNQIFHCNSGSAFTPKSLDQRHLEVSFNDNSGSGEQTLPLMDVNFVPFSVNTYDAQNIGGTPANSVLRVNGGTATPLSPAHFSELVSLINGSSTQYEKAGQLSGSSLPPLGNGQVLGWSASGWTAVTPTTTDTAVKSFAKTDLPSCGPSQFLKNDGGGNLICDDAITELADASITGAKLENSGVVAGEYTKVQVDIKGRVLTGSNLSATDIPNLDANKITSGTLTQNVNATTVAATNINARNLRIYDGVSEYLTWTLPAGGTGYSLNWPNSAGADGDVLRLNASGNLVWSAIPSAPVTKVAGRTGDVTLSNTDISGLGTSAVLNVAAAGDAAVGEVVKGNDTRLTNGRAPAGGASGDLGGSYPNPTVAKIQGRAVDATAPSDGQALLWDQGNSTWKAQYVRAQDIRTAWGGTQMIPAAACGANQAMVWSTITDRFTCQAIGSLDAAKITSGVFATARLGTGTADATKVLLGNGTWATAPVSSQWVSNGNNIAYNNGYVGIGNTNPLAALHITEKDDAWESSIRMDRSWDSATDYFQMMYDYQGLKIRTMSGDSDDAHIIFKPKNSETVRFTEDGKVGIGTATPLSTLEIVAQNPNLALVPKSTPDSSAGFHLYTLRGQWNESLGSSNPTGGNRGWSVGGAGSSHPTVGQRNSFFLNYWNGTSWVAAVHVLSTGAMGVGTTAPEEKLHVIGNIKANSTVYTSDIRYKRNIAVIENPIEKILSLRGVTYDWRRDEFPEQQFPARHQLGVIAQEVEKQFPEAVNTDSHGYKSVNYPSLVAPLIEAVKELYGKLLKHDELLAAEKTAIQKLQKENLEKDKEIQELKTRLDRLEKHLSPK